MAIRGGAVLAFATAAVLLAGCVSSTPGEPSRAAEPTTSLPVPTAPVAVDLSKLGAITSAFPPDHPANSSSGVRDSDAARAAGVGDHYSHGEPLTTDPDACRLLLDPVESAAGSRWAAVNHAAGPQGPFIGVEADSPVVSRSMPGSGCEAFTFTVEGPFPSGTVHRLPAPSIDAAQSYGLKVDFEVTNPDATEPPIVEYLYAAVLDGGTFVSVWARVPSDFAAEPVLGDLLSNAAAAIRS